MSLESLREFLLDRLSRRAKMAILVAVDVVSLLAAVWLSYSIRLGEPFRPSNIQLLLMGLAPVIAVPVFIRMGLYRAVIRYLPDRAIWTILRALATSTLIWIGVLFLAEVSRFGTAPRSVPLGYFVIGSMLVAGWRFLARRLLATGSPGDGHRRSVLIYGAGDAGTQLASALRTSGEHVVGFLDDDKRLHGRDVAGVRVYPPDLLGELVENYGVREVILSIGNLTGARRQDILKTCSAHPVEVRVLPAISDLAQGKYLINQLRTIDISDLLGRSSVPAHPELLRNMIKDRAIMVTGAGGSIGSELAKLLLEWGPKRLVLFEANEFALYQVERALRAADATIPIEPVLGSVTDSALVRATLSGQQVAVVFHAAAHKHVPLVEANALEGVRNNVVGTRVLAEESLRAGVESFVLISSDKAVRPTNVMGATKRWSEFIIKVCQAKAGKDQRFSAVRFGNVLGSNGSVIPLFQEQIAAGGPVTLTDSRMTRYFMSIHEAAELIVQAGTLSVGGDLFLLDMGQPIRIQDLAENMIHLAGLTVRDNTRPDGDIEIVETGIRPGEKLFEELFFDPMQSAPTRHPKILRAGTEELNSPDFEAALADLERALTRRDEIEVRRLLFAAMDKTAVNDQLPNHVRKIL